MEAKDLAGPSQENDGTLAAMAKTIRNIQNNDKNKTEQDQLSTLRAEDNTSRPFTMTPEEEERLVQEMREEAEKQNKPKVAQADRFWVVATLNARKGDVKRAIAVLENYLEWRKKVEYDANTPANSEKMREIMEDDLFVCAGNESRDGRPVLAVRYRYFNPKKYSALDAARSFGFIVEWMLRMYPKAQTHGIVVIEDVAGFSLKNFDLRLISFLESAFTKTLPVRIAALHIANPGVIIRAMMALFGKFFSDKLKMRIRLFGKKEIQQFQEFFAPDQNLSFLGLGGELEWTEDDRKKLTEKIVAECQTWPQATTYQA